MYKIAKKAKHLFNNVSLDDVIQITDFSRNILPYPKTILPGHAVFGAGIYLTNNEIDIVKIIKSVENRGNLLKRNTTNITSQIGVFINFLKPLITAGLPLMRNLLTLSAKSVLRVAISATYTAT